MKREWIVGLVTRVIFGAALSALLMVGGKSRLEHVGWELWIVFVVVAVILEHIIRRWLTRIVHEGNRP